jgi:signal transduction histidine kinase
VVEEPDLLLALAASAVVLIGSGVTLGDDWEISLAAGTVEPWLPGPVGLVLLLVGSLPLTFRRVAPLTVLGVAVAASIAYQALGHHPEPLPVAVLVALYAVAVFRRPLVCSIAAAVYVAVVTAAALAGWLPLTDDEYYVYLVSVVATVMLGYGVALSRARATVAEQKAAALSRDSETRMQAAVEQEQARIAREVHDIVAHDVSVIVAQAAAARRVFPAQPEKALDSLTSIEAVGRDALDGLRRLMGLLRSRPDDEDRSPQPSLARLPFLLAQLERAGLDVELTVTGTPGLLPATVELNAYRIVQEALTNSLKHAGPTRASVTLEYGPDSLQVEVRDHGGTPSAKPPSTGFGLVGMQQRATMLGGVLVAGPAVDRGFRVSARLPLAGAAT